MSAYSVGGATFCPDPPTPQPLHLGVWGQKDFKRNKRYKKIVVLGDPLRSIFIGYVPESSPFRGITLLPPPPNNIRVFYRRGGPLRRIHARTASDVVPNRSTRSAAAEAERCVCVHDAAAERLAERGRGARRCGFLGGCTSAHPWATAPACSLPPAAPPSIRTTPRSARCAADGAALFSRRAVPGGPKRSSTG